MCATLQVLFAPLVAAVVAPIVCTHVPAPVTLGLFAALTVCAGAKAAIRTRSQAK